MAATRVLSSGLVLSRPVTFVTGNAKKLEEVRTILGKSIPFQSLTLIVMEKSCSHWWHAPVYFTISVFLAFLAVSTTFRSNPNDNNAAAVSSSTPVTTELPLNASQALRKSGFNTIATLLQISPQLFLSSSQSTVFAIQDSALSNITLHGSVLMKQLIQYHVVPFRLSMNDLLKKQENSCLQTLLPDKNLSITKINAKKRVLEINHVRISLPDLILGGPVSVHGVVGPFSPLESNSGLDFIQSHACGSSNSSVLSDESARNKDEWTQIVRVLSSKGFVSFAIGLHAVLDGILQDYKNLSSVTLFAPPDMAILTANSPLLDKTVRLHILPRRYTYTILASLAVKSHLRTLVPDCDLQITGISNVMHRLVINGVDITSPEMFTSKNFVIHGIQRAFETAEFLPSTT